MTGTVRWERLHRLLISLEHGFETASRLDAYDRPSRTTDDLRDKMESRLSALEYLMDKELDRLTAERLKFELGRKMSEAAKRAA